MYNYTRVKEIRKSKEYKRLRVIFGIIVISIFILPKSISFAFSYMARVSNDNFEFDDAVNRATIGIWLNKDNDLAYFERGYAYDELGEYEQAKHDYMTIIDLGKEDASTYHNLAHTYEMLENFEVALEFYNLSLEFDENNQKALTYNSRASVYMKMYDFGAALKDLDSAINLNNKLGDAYFLRGLIHSFNNNIDKAILDMTEAIKINEFDIQAIEYRATLYAAIGETKLAEDDIARAEKLKNLD